MTRQLPAFVCAALAATVALVPGCSPAAQRPVVIGSKKFTESVILAEMGTQLARAGGAEARRDDLGGTPALWLALTQGDIDAYPEYTGTITRQILKDDPPDLAAALAAQGVRISKPLGFRNNYALGMRKDVAAAKGVRSISYLRQHPELRCGFIHEFLDRPDGWPGVKRHYDLPQTDVRGMNHTLAYRALVERAIDVTEVYTTDGEIAQYDLLVLDDDRNFFPAYEAVWLYRADLESRHPKAVEQLRRLEGRVTEPQMQRMNSLAQGEQKKDEREVAGEFLTQTLGVTAGATAEPGDGTLAGRVLETTREHLKLVLPSLLAAVLVAVPLGVLAARRPALGRVALGATGVLQTVPSLALLLFMIPVMKWLVDEGTGPAPAIAALFLYSLLPIVRNAHAGLTSIPAPLRESAAALGLSPWAILWRIELPLAAPTILAGVRTAAVINVGTATLGGFIGAGGYGRPILRGIDKFDVPLMLEGAIPAAVLALAIEGLFGLVERAVARRG
ncbi:Glycine betaine/carnitine/choline transport system permease protein OpuCB [Gemmata obscuriglobus]|uniref:Amino acid ABC transporter permease n=1 Tax=Gemmata obscuriglobus TaxID=114 RepID=A0A2Z3H4X1_9BACT|nr:glycine betaine ABC transporter substrate-binding protein [Gemmata obscuriglobus]AWM41053.1 amino acid ABC transporter permease [Gemmata obscuriglobus]QEG25622.1 Glycine betaine/carnitine/choline transport system permease protein OpuCB [Gemmata obscuriglobus]VTR99136.1 amino acid abc transporter permease : Amino acid ABC transporter permease OS=Cystobacter violaceus Cb vi76 GN=Q664_24870 PE=3 SV=1: OpuAC: BPD_transp_1 [Gemmata obscuriglobus UQM 2246]